ncbi:MAG: A24 family peptidase [Pigmentiphaga sp.]
MESYSESLAALPSAAPWIVAVLLGLALGSFVNVVIARLPRMLERGWHEAYAEVRGESAVPEPPYNLARPGSHCPHCGHVLSWLELLPVVSWCWQRGRCRHCRAAISWQYPLVEVAGAILAAACYWRFGLHPYALAAFGASLALLALAVIDLQTLLLPDDITQPLLWSGLLVAVAGWGPILPTAAIIGAAAGYAALWLLATVYRLITGREGMGQGDFKLLAALGAWLGPLALPPIVLAASVLGLAAGVYLMVRQRAHSRTPLPFGPCLALAGAIQFFLLPPVRLWPLG